MDDVLKSIEAVISIQQKKVEEARLDYEEKSNSLRMLIDLEKRAEHTADAIK